MKRIAGFALVGFFALIAGGTAAKAQTPPSKAKPPALWVSAYYGGWDQTSLRPEDIDLRPVTDLVYFSLVPSAAGTAAPGGWYHEDDVAALARVAHAAGKKVLITIGGSDSAALFRPDIAAANRDGFVRSIVAWVEAHGYDGVDIDMEPVEDSDAPDFDTFITELRRSLKAANSNALLTAAVGPDPTPYAPILAEFDRINIMTYDISGPWEGWQTWYNSPLHNGGLAFSNGRPLPCVDTYVKGWTDAGATPASLGIGIDFDEKVWTGASGPNQPIAGVTVADASYAVVTDQYDVAHDFHWDDAAGSGYLSIPGATPSATLFISYDDARACRAKVRYAREHGLRGIILWEVGKQYRPFQPLGERNPLLAALYAALTSP
jgi:chitinase